MEVPFSEDFALSYADQNVIYLPISVFWWEFMDCDGWAQLGLPDYPPIIDDSDNQYFANWFGGPYPKNVVLSSDMEVLHVSLNHDYNAIESGILLGLSQIPENAGMEPNFQFGSNYPVASDLNLTQRYPDIDISPSGRIHLAWHSNDWPISTIQYAWSDNGISFDSDVQLSDPAAVPVDAIGAGPRVVAVDNRVIVVWTDARNGSDNTAIYMTYSDDEGQTWQNDQEVSDLPNAAGMPDIAVAQDGSAQLIYYQYDDDTVLDARLTKAAPGTIAFEPSVGLDLSGGYGSPCANSGPDLEIAPNGDIFIAFRNSIFSERDPYLTRILAGTSEVYTVVPMYWSGWQTEICFDAGPVIGLNNVRVGTSFVIEDEINTYVQFGVQENMLFTPPSNVNPNSPSWQSYPDVVMTGEYLHMVWVDNTTPYPDIYYGYGKTYEPGIFNIQRVNDDPTMSYVWQQDPRIEFFDEVLYTVWSDPRNGTSQIYLASTTDNNSLPGDVNSDALVNILDIVMMVNFIIGAVEPDPLAFTAADINLDGQLNILDIVQVINIITG